MISDCRGKFLRRENKKRNGRHIITARAEQTRELDLNLLRTSY